MAAVLFDNIKSDVSHKWSGISEDAFIAGNISNSARFEPFVVIEDNVEIGSNTIIGLTLLYEVAQKLGVILS